MGSATFMKDTRSPYRVTKNQEIFSVRILGVLHLLMFVEVSPPGTKHPVLSNVFNPTNLSMNNITYLYCIIFSRSYEQLYCKKYHECDPWEYPPVYSCGQVSDTAKHIHHECSLKNGVYLFTGTLKSQNWFDCLNREDESNTIFRKTVYPVREQSLKISLLLNYTTEYFYCNEDEIYNWTVDGINQMGVST